MLSFAWIQAFSHPLICIYTPIQTSESIHVDSFIRLKMFLNINIEARVQEDVIFLNFELDQTKGKLDQMGGWNKGKYKVNNWQLTSE